MKRLPSSFWEGRALKFLSFTPITLYINEELRLDVKEEPFGQSIQRHLQCPSDCDYEQSCWGFAAALLYLSSRKTPF